VNTEARDLFYKNIGGGNALYTSTFDSDGYGDVRFYDAGVPISIDTVKLPTSPVVVVKPNETIATGLITNSKTGQTINATLSFVSEATLAKTEASLSGYQITLANGLGYKITVEAKGFISYFQSVMVNKEQAKLELDFALQPIEVGTTVNLKSVLFKQSSTDLLPESKDELNVVASFMKTNPKVKIELSGHTDNRGVQKDNEKLSQARVQKVKEYLVASGVSAKRISGKGYGGAKPIAVNDTEESRRLNRRVEFTIVKN
jgi:outer membrane protein OmpA-like peptidoglycan-associated protein